MARQDVRLPGLFSNQYFFTMNELNQPEVENGAANKNPDLENAAGNAGNPQTPPSADVAPKTDEGKSGAPAKSSPGVLAKLSKLLGGNAGSACTCGRAGSGKQGRHKSTCPVSGASAPKHFGAVVAQDGNASGAGQLALVPTVPDMPVDGSWAGRIANSVLRIRLGFVRRKVRKSFAPIPERFIEPSEVLELAREAVKLDEKEVDDFRESWVHCAEHYKKNPKHAPLFDALLNTVSLESSIGFNFDKIEMRLATIQKLLEADKKATTAQN